MAMLDKCTRIFTSNKTDKIKMLDRPYLTLFNSQELMCSRWQRPKRQLLNPFNNSKRIVLPQVLLHKHPHLKRRHQVARLVVIENLVDQVQETKLEVVVMSEAELKLKKSNKNRLLITFQQCLREINQNQLTTPPVLMLLLVAGRRLAPHPRGLHQPGLQRAGTPTTKMKLKEEVRAHLNNQSI